MSRRLHQAPWVHAAVAIGDLDVAAQPAVQRHPEVIVCVPRTLPGAAVGVVHVLAATGAAVVVLTSSLYAGEAAALERAGARAIVLKGSALTTLVESITKAQAGWDRAAPVYAVR